MKLFLFIILSFPLYFMSSCSPSRKTKASSNSSFHTEKAEKEIGDSFMVDLLKQYPQFFDSILAKKDELNVQVIYTQIDRNKKGKPRFTDHTFNLDADKYYYPASTVKLPIAILALQKLNELKMAGLNKNTTMMTEADYGGQTVVCNDPTTADGRPTIAHYIKKILLVSDNDAFNRLYEFLGQEYINNSLHKMGYKNAEIIHRLNISLSEEENRHTNPIKFYDTNGKMLYEKPAAASKLVFAERNIKMGKGYYRGDVLINEPFDFSKKNRLPLSDLHTIVRSILFPEGVSAKHRFNLTREDYDFLRKYMSMMPQESKFPFYDTVNYWDTYVKFLYYGAEKGAADPAIRVFNKPGDAYGFMTDAAYIANYKTNTEFMLSAVIYANSDGIFNDDKYDYNTIALPFLKNLGHVIYNCEQKRTRKYTPDLSSLRFNYTD